jgi:hypothetical protein
MTFNVNNNNNKYEKNYFKIDQLIYDINSIIMKICKEQVLKTIDDRCIDILLKVT